MDDRHFHNATMIGLHKLAEHSGDGLVPELLNLMVRRERLLQDSPNVVAFPASRARGPIRRAFEVAQSAAGTILAFRSGRTALPKDDRR